MPRLQQLSGEKKGFKSDCGSRGLYLDNRSAVLRFWLLPRVLGHSLHPHPTLLAHFTQPLKEERGIKNVFELRVFYLDKHPTIGGLRLTLCLLLHLQTPHSTLVKKEKGFKKNFEPRGLCLDKLLSIETSRFLPSLHEYGLDLRGLTF